MRIRMLLGTVIACLSLASAATVVEAYTGQSPFQISVSGPSRTVRCNQDVTLTATVLDAKSGKPVPLQNVSWTITSAQSGSDSLSARVTRTNRQGRTSVGFSFGPAAGARTVTASATIARGSVTVRCAGGLPVTSTDPAGAPGAVDAKGAAALGGLGLAVLLWVGWVWRSRRPSVA